MVDLAVLAAMTLAGWKGWQRGALLMLLGLAAFAAGYVGAALLFRPFGGWLSGTFQLSPIIALPLAATLVMGLLTATIRIATLAVERRRAEGQQQGVPPSRLNSAGGALIGAIEAAGYAVVLAWIVMTVHTIAHVGPDISTSMTGRAAGGVMKRASYAVTSRLTGDPFVATMLSVVATRPQEGVEALNVLMRNQHVRGLLTNPSLRAELARGDVAALERDPAVRSLAADPQFLGAASRIGFAPGQPGQQALAQTLATRVAPLARAVQSLSHDEEIHRLMSSPELARMLDQGNVAGLVRDPQFNRLAGRILEVLRGGATAPGR